MEHIYNNDDYYDEEVEYKVQWKGYNKLHYIIFKTLKDLFDDLYDNKGKLVFNTDKKKQIVRDALNKNFWYDEDGLEIIQIDLSEVNINNNIPKAPVFQYNSSNDRCSCPIGFKREGAFCKVHRD